MFNKETSTYQDNIPYLKEVQYVRLKFPIFLLRIFLVNDQIDNNLQIKISKRIWQLVLALAVRKLIQFEALDQIECKLLNEREK